MWRTEMANDQDRPWGQWPSPETPLTTPRDAALALTAALQFHCSYLLDSSKVQLAVLRARLIHGDEVRIGHLRLRIVEI